MSDIVERVEQIRMRLNRAALERWGRAPQIIAVSKTVSAPFKQGPPHGRKAQKHVAPV